METPGPIRRHGCRAWPTTVGARSRQSLAAWTGSRNNGSGRGRVDARGPAHATSSGGATRNTLTMVSHWSPTMASMSSRAIDLVGVRARELGDAPARPWSARPGSPCGCRARRRPGPAARRSRRGGRPPRQALRAAVAGHVDGDDLEAPAHQAVQGLGVEEALGGEAVDDDERHAPAADRQARSGGRRQRDGVAGQPRRGTPAWCPRGSLVGPVMGCAALSMGAGLSQAGQGSMTRRTT